MPNDLSIFQMNPPGIPDAVLSDPAIVNGVETSLTLTSDGLLRWSEGGPRCLAVEKEVLGFSADGPRITIRAVVEGGDGFLCFGSKGALVRKNFVFELLSEDSLRLWCEKLREYIDALGRPKRLLVFVNPFGGKKSGSKIFVDQVKPLLEDADIHITLYETKYQLHAKDVVCELDLTAFDGIVCVSGDGILVEVVNGLLQREDWAAAIKMPIGVVPAGTGNGMAKSLLDSAGDPCTVPNALLTIIRGHTHALDVATVSQGETRFFSVLMLAWGLIADVDIESEKYRWMGSARIDFYALQRILNLRMYQGRVSFVPAPGFETHGEPTDFKGESTSDAEPVSDKKRGYRYPNNNSEILEWRTIEGPFVSVWLHNVPWGGEDTMAAPDAEFSDGYLDLILIKDCPKMALLSLMTELGSGNHVKSPFVTYIKVKAFILEPGTRVDEPSTEGIIDCDGEVLAWGKGTDGDGRPALMVYDKLEIRVHQGLATLFSPLAL